MRCNSRQSRMLFAICLLAVSCIYFSYAHATNKRSVIKPFFVYVIAKVVNHEAKVLYVGHTVNFSRRKNEHIRSGNLKDGELIRVYCKVNNRRQALVMEQTLINKYDTKNNGRNRINAVSDKKVRSLCVEVPYPD